MTKSAFVALPFVRPPFPPFWPAPAFDALTSAYTLSMSSFRRYSLHKEISVCLVLKPLHHLRSNIARPPKNCDRGDLLSYLKTVKTKQYLKIRSRRQYGLTYVQANQCTAGYESNYSIEAEF